MKKIAVFPGSFDPFTKGHEDVVNRFLPLFDQIIIGFGINTKKQYMFDTESRIKHVSTIYQNEPKVVVKSYQGLTVDFCKNNEAGFLIRGVRNTVDFEYEKAIAQMNKDIANIETVLFFTDKEVSAISSSIIREIKKNNADISAFVTNEELLIINT